MTKNYYYILEKLTILIACFIIGYFIYSTSFGKLESFDNSSTQQISVLQTSPQNFAQWIKLHTNWTPIQVDNTQANWKANITSIQEQSFSGIASGSQPLLLCDPLDKDTYFPSVPEYKLSASDNPVPPGYFIAIVHPQIRKTIDVAYNFENKTIGYIYQSDYYFIQAIIQSYRMNESSIKLIQLNPSDIQDIIPVITSNQIDILVTYIILQSDTYNYIEPQFINIMGFANLDFKRVNLFYPYITFKNMSLRDIFIKRPFADYDNSVMLPQMTMKLLDMPAQSKTATVVSSVTPLSSAPSSGQSPASIETFITRIELDQESVAAGYNCYGNPYVESKAECESPNDLYGHPVQPIKWDKTCSKDEECPFYKKNTNYPNTRGKCLESGLCEMPIGVLQASPRKFFDSGRFNPFCYGCTPGNDPNCCKITEDYAFVNDTDDRRAAGLKTSISLM